ncbi:MAG: glycosyltransferase [Paracoccaceae bacterium]|nr:glycosyltransferase [Paracoccaceae bacterium]
MFMAPLSLVRTPGERPATLPRARARTQGPLIGQILVARGALAPGDLVKALALRERQDTRLGEILLTHGMVSEAEFYAALADQWQSRLVDIVAEPPDPRLIDAAGAESCLRHRLVPWRRVGGATVVVTARPEEFARRAEELPARLRPALMAVASERDVLDALLALRSRRLAWRAETLAPEAESCRIWDGRRFRRRCLAALALIAATHIGAPVAAFAALTGLAIVALLANIALRVGALLTGAHRHLRERLADGPPPTPPAIARLPVVSILVPLYHETAIAERLLVRLSRLTYPRELLDICLVTEDNDETTRAALAATRLPRWLRVVTVPEGTLRTKPRALNYALDFCRGSIVGVYDAEDAPDPDQIHRVVARFHERGPDVACLQGVLDYYNARSNWMARCFALEYAAWFRVVLPGLERMGLAIPLGGTTLFFRRAALEELGGWDAHNVTEDADLGIRLARHGYRAELIDTVTEEEANCRPWPWVRQRSRWIKGYAMTWAVHMRAPRRLWRQLGPRKFIGMQVLFGGSLMQSFLAPVLWSYWLLILGLPHPLGGAPVWAAVALEGLFLFSWAVNVAAMLVGVSGPRHRHLMPWAFTLGLYFPLATLAAAKALFEMVTKPFFWDKTCHGIDDAAHEAPPASDLAAAPGQIRAPAPVPRPALTDPIGELRP